MRDRGAARERDGSTAVSGAVRRRRPSVFQLWGMATLAGTVALITLGATVRVTDSGLACPDWPLCNGKLVPGGDYHVWIEWTHRLVASIVGLAIVAFVIGAWRAHRDRAWVVLPITAALVVLGVQVILGGLTVTENLPPEIVTAHLGTALVLVLLLTVGLLASFATPSARRAGPALRVGGGPAVVTARLAAATLVSVLALMLVGSWVSGSEAGFACGGWPLCNDSLLPAGDRPALHMAHRYLAAGVGLVVLATMIAAWRGRRTEPRLLLLAVVVGALYLAQVFIGAANIWTTLTEWARVLHVAVAASLWLGATVLAAWAAERAAWVPSVARTGPRPSLRPWRPRMAERRAND